MAKKWYVKELSKLTGVSVRTLHHYDNVNLLKPSERLENGYRKYSEEDLLKLQQIIALKSFGFKLMHIRNILLKNISLIDNLKNQTIFLKGKAKSLYTTSKDDRLVMHFSDDTSAFDGKKKEALLGKGAVNNQFNAFIMDHLQNNGIETHHIEVLNNNDSLVWNLNMFPVECVIRNRASGSICRRLGTEDGLILESPLFEFFLKDDDLGDPLINDEHIISFGWATKDQIDEMKKLTYKVNSVLKELFINSGLILVDFKVEFGVNGNGTILLADEFTPDGCRLWDSETLKKMDKDRFRQGLGDVVESYHQVADRLGMNIIVD